MAFDSSKQGMQIFLSVLMIIIKEVKELDRSNTSKRESPKTVVGISGFEIVNSSHLDQASNKLKEFKKSSMLKKF